MEGTGFLLFERRSNAALAAKTYGGGGGGGRLHIKWKLGQSVFASTNNQDWTENFTGNFSFAGGYPNGNYGHLATPKCPTGSYLYLYSPDGGSPKCIACQR